MRLQRKFASLFLVLFALPALLSAATVTPLRQGWRLQSACKLLASGDAISAHGFAVPELDIDGDLAVAQRA